MLSKEVSKYQPKNVEELSQEIATLIAEGFLAFHPTSPMNLNLQIALKAYRENPESTLVGQIMTHCREQIASIALSVI